MLTKRISAILDSNQPKKAAGFQSDNSIPEHIFVINKVMKNIQEINEYVKVCVQEYINSKQKFSSGSDHEKEKEKYECEGNEFINQNYLMKSNLLLV